MSILNVSCYTLYEKAGWLKDCWGESAALSAGSAEIGDLALTNLVASFNDENSNVGSDVGSMVEWFLVGSSFFDAVEYFVEVYGKSTVEEAIDSIMIDNSFHDDHNFDGFSTQSAWLAWRNS